jgi:hypothetical protein
MRQKDGERMRDSKKGRECEIERKGENVRQKERERM